MSRASSAVDVAAMPLARSMADSAPSALAIVCSTATVVGFPYREYRNFFDFPSLNAFTSAALSKTNVVVS